MVVTGMVILEFLEVLELTFEVTNLALVAFGTSRGNFALILGDVLVDGFHDSAIKLAAQTIRLDKPSDANEARSFPPLWATPHTPLIRGETGGIAQLW